MVLGLDNALQWPDDGSGDQFFFLSQARVHQLTESLGKKGRDGNPTKNLDSRWTEQPAPLWLSYPTRTPGRASEWNFKSIKGGTEEGDNSQYSSENSY